MDSTTTQTISNPSPANAPRPSPGPFVGPRTYHGSCVCGAVRYEVELDLSAGTSQCNCSICTKASLWSAFAPPAAFKLLSGEESLADFQRGAKFSHYLFCKHCGVRSFARGDAPWMGGPYVAINVNCLDDADGALGGVLVRHFDGRHDRWENPRLEWTPPAVADVQASEAARS